jgi:UDP-glucuronate decarboxylase
VVSNFIVQALENRDLTIFGNGDQVRSFCYVDDLIDALVLLFFKDTIYEPINLGNPKPIKMLDLALEIIKVTNSKSKIVFQPLPLDDPFTREPDISKAKSQLNWEPRISREEGINRTVEYFKRTLQAGSE